MTDERTIVACVDGSAYAAAACDAAIWAAGKLDAPLTFVNVISRRKHAAAADYSGQIGLGTREHLLTELAELDGQRARLARERGRDFLDTARQRAEQAGRPDPTTRQRNGELVDALHSMDDEIRLLAIGKRGESAGDDDHLGSNLERVIRGVSCPILVTNQSFTPPQRVLIAFDGSKTGQRVIERAVATPLLSEVEVHLVYVGQPNDERRRQIDAAAETLRAAGATLTTAVLEGDVEPALHDYQRQHGLDLMVMGAYGHTRIRQLLVGSTTTDMIRRAEVPLLIVR
ncbi:universal stress protein [Salinisphaera hydrothermalis]|uniref:Usp domain-containing protein n=1 Tax=Salinisphaera hydrothermalis (strain C41B8) TaxID=1304275 RepID=A0A084IH65_SALHC|nr:universal stress protein [Salinisphaera hydrothermalis]KEZ76049.1 Usp domain-containing protein [Salinisphaera hydrothermalis C41B8]